MSLKQGNVFITQMADRVFVIQNDQGICQLKLANTENMKTFCFFHFHYVLVDQIKQI